MTYNPNLPQATDYIDESQPELLVNFQQLNTLYDLDHYAFNDGTANVGLHQKITSPDQAAHVTTTTHPILYGYEPTANIGDLQWSRGPSNAVPTPLTSLHGNVANLGGSGSPTTILDFTGMGDCLATLTLSALEGGGKLLRSAPIAFDGTSVFSSGGGGTITWGYSLNGSNQNSITARVASSTELEIYAAVVTITDVVWTLSFQRAE